MSCDNKGRKATALCVLTAILCFVSCLDFVAANSLKDPYICGPPACIPSGKFKYNPNIVYHYDYHVDINTWFSGSSNNQSTLDIKISISLEFLTACEGLLRLNSVSMIDQDENFPEERGHSFAKLLTQYPLRFAFHEGVIMEICPHEGEEDWVLNFKRSILSLFQNSMKRFDIDFKGTEKDIHGTCDAVYNVRGQDNTSLVIVKSRDLTNCMDRYKYLSILQTVRYNFQSKYQTWPVLKSESKCRISVDHYVYKTVNCRERHLFEPFSGKQSGAMTTVIQDLTLAKEVNKTDLEIMEQKSQEWESIKLRTNLLHQHSSFVRPATGELKSARDVLKLLCRIDETVSDTNPGSEARMADQLDGGSIVGLWGSLVRACRGLHHPALSQLLARATAICPRAKKHVLDALPYIASIGSVELIKDMIIKNTADEETTEEWLMSMAMIPRPKKEMIISMSELLKHSPSDRLIGFTASSMVHSYCKHGAQSLSECCRERQNQDIINIFHNNVITIIGDGTTNLTRDLKEKVTVSIKSLGNIGGFSKDVENKLIGIIDNSNMPISVRLAAIDAFRKTPCVETREYFLHLFREDFVDIEVRLASYLQVMRCPNLATIRKILHALRHESVHQAASFVWSHLDNLGKSSIPSRVEIQGLLSGSNIPEPSHKPDFRKYSKNYEQSVFFDQYNAGGNYEANVIFSPDSYIPRSVSLNLTVDMFGESINLLEVRARGEGFEKYFEGIFGAEGPLSQSIVEEKLESLRMFRSINKPEGLKAKIDSLGYKNEAMNHQFPLADLGIKVFGNEISYWNAEGDGEIRSSLKKLNPLYYINKILSGKEISYKKASLFLDTTYVIPTGCGLPLTMNLMGTSYVNLKMAGSIAGAENFFTTKSLDFEGKIHPSIALNIAATMGVRAGSLSSTGIRLNMRLYTSTAVEAKLKLRGTSLVHLDLSLPHNKQEIFGAKSELIILHGEKENQQMGLNENRIQASTCSWTAVDKAIGIKICAAYQFPNMTNLHNAPYFLMSGPAQYLVSLEKVDPTAKKYSFKYDWKSNETADIISFSFDTPDSKTKRMFNASISSLQNSGTASMIFQSAENTLKAHATYKNLPGDKYLESVLDIDGQKHFDAVMSLTKQPQKNGYIYIPKLYLAVNNERITELAGTLRVAQKKGVSQCDVLLEFQTKRLASRLIGYITWNGPSKGARLRLDYQFLNERKESIKIDALLSNRAIGSRYNLYGELGLEFTSYPHLNFFTDVKYVSSSGHIESSLNLSSSREMRDENSRLQFHFALHKKLDGIKLLSNLALHRPEINFLVSFEESGAQYSALARITYDEVTRDVELAGQLYWPPGALLYVDGNLNITLPAMHPFSAQVVVHEKRAHEFDIRATCIWFTGLDVTIAALYQDQSSTHMASHHLKALITSSQFKDVAGDARFTQDNRQTNFLIEGDYNKEKYGALMRYVLYSDQNFTIYGQVDVKSKVYSLNCIADLNNNTNLVADLHIDQVRDIHLTYLRSYTPKLKRLSAMLNWDANRDPSQKLSVDLQLQTKGTWNYGGAVTVYYPGRIVSGEFDFLFRDWFCQWLVKLGWSPEDIILWKVKMYSEVQKETIYALLSEMNTPFQGWKDTSFNVMWRYQDNLQALNGSMTWQKDYLTFGLLGDYLFKTNEFYGEINANVNSTIAALPRAAAIARHKHTWKKSADTLLSFQYNNDGVMMVNSSWQLDRSSSENNISGRVALMTPFPGYKNGLLRTRFVFSNNNRQVKGITHLTLEEKIFTISVDGYMRRITNSMLIINVTSPIAAYAHIQGRFGFVEVDRHLVAMVIAPNTTTGIEIRLRLMSTQDFHIFGHLALPIQFLQRAMILAKRSEEEMNFKLGWDKMDFGFTGIWHYKSVLNFQYVYKVFTPLDGFEENGLVLKNVYNDGLDTEFSIRLSKHKFGISILVNDKEQGLLKLIDDKLNNRKRKYTDQIIENFSTYVYMTLNTLYYPTITFTAFLNKVDGENAEEILNIKADLNLPNRTAIVLTDTFILEDLTTMRNNLHLVTPFQILPEVKSVYTVEITLSEKYNVSMAADIRNGTDWLKTSLHVFYEYDTGEDEEYAAHTASLHIATPLLVLPALSAEVGVHIEDAVTRMSADVEMPSFQITARGQIERDDTYIESVGSLNLTSPYLESYFISMNFKKDFSDIENSVACGLQVQQGEQNNYFFAETLWHPATVNNLKFKLRGALETVLPPSEVSLNFRNEPKDKHRFVHAEGKIGSDDNFYLLNAEQKTGFTTLALKSPHSGFRNVNLTGEIKNNDAIVGFLHSDTVSYVIDGKITNKSPLEMTIALIPEGAGERHTLQVRYVAVPGQYSLTASILETMQLTAHAKLETNDQFTDVYFKVDTNHPTYKDIYLKSRVDLFPDNKGILSIDAVTPLKSIKHLKGNADMVIGPQSGYVKCSYDMTKMKGDGDLQWSFIWNDMYLKALGHQLIAAKARSVDFKAFYGNTTEDITVTSKAGFHMDLDKVWQIGANSTFGVIPNQKMDLTLNAFLPKPNVDVHTFLASYNNGNNEDLTKEVIVRYTTDVTKIIGGIDGQMLMLPNDLNGNASIKWGAASVVNSVDNRLHSIIKNNNSMAIDYRLITPLYAGEDTLDIKGSFEKILADEVMLIEGVAACPQSNHIGDIDLSYGGLKKTAGNFNFTTPFRQLPWFKCDLNISNQEYLFENQIQAFWPNKSSTLNSTHKWYNDTNDSALGQEGVISVSVPLNTKHYISSNYAYLQADRWSKGNATLTFNGKEYVEGAFTKVTEKSERDLDIDKMDIKIENVHTPLGIKYLHEYNENGNIDVKQATFYHLHNASRFNVTGKIDIDAWETGKTLKLMAVHSNRTLTFENNYEAKDKDFLQGSKIKWAPDVWINYDIHVTNKSHDDTESQEIVMNVWYPLKQFNLVALYHLQDTLLNGTAQLNWNIHGENKTSEVKGRWQNPSKMDTNVHNVDIFLSHPSFRKDVNLKGFYSSDSSTMSNISIDLEYSEYKNEHLQFKSLLIDNSNGPSRDYKFDLFCKHPATNLDLEIRSDLNIQKRWYYFNSYYKYQKSLFYQTMKENKGLLDMKNALLKYERNTETDYFKLIGTWDMVYPDYKMNVDVNRTKGNDTGIAMLSMKDKFVLAHFNRTDDVSYHLIGIINDARSAQLNAWRDFDDVKTADVSSYIRLNHSRLLTSSIFWRPDIYQELKSSVIMTFKDIYVNVNETLMLMKSAPMETHMALKNVWNDAKPRVREFLDDLNDLHVIKYDLDEFQLFLNQSYHTNDFYVKDIVEFSYYIIDQMSIRNHLESLPDIVNEMWVIMGDTGKSMKASILWIIEYIKTSYSNFVENVNVILNTDFMDQVSNLMEGAITKYDSFVKNIHLKLVTYWETTWVNVVTKIGATWKRFLKSMEPSVLKFVHYAETFVYKLSKEVMDFFYARTNELTESPYFSLLTNLSQDLDKFWKDMKTNDAITNIQKYSKIVWNFVNDKFLVHIPFRKELQEISMEIWNELNQLQELSVVKYAKAKFWEAKTRLQWWYDYFRVSDALDKIVDILYKKASEIAKTALQNEETHRVPKTNFIFDPHKGQIILEQKLPMSWHGFNRTPDFTEISEYKMLHNILDHWVLSNKTLWSYYYEVKPYLDVHNILPPFDGFAVMTGNGALVTFDRSVYTISKTGTFVLVHDYREENFTILMESNDLGRYDLALLARKQLIHIDMYREVVTIGQSVALTLPASVDDWILDREVDSVTVQNKYGINIACNFLFKTCKIQIRGWYFASLGGLLGTMNNEQYDDQQLTTGQYTTSPEALADSWNIEDEETRSTAPIQNRETQNDTLCEKFFENKVSPLHPCFSMIDSTPFFKECISGVDPCTLANSYLELCASDHVSIHMPEQCVQCTSPQGEPIEDGYVYELPNVPHSTDVVFIVEAEFCNVNIRKSKNIDVLISALDGKLQENGLKDNRYAIIVFGGSGLYKKARSLYVNNQLFSPPSEIPENFDNIYIEKQDTDANKTRPSDMFAALSYASALPFRPGVSRTFIMLPCTRCDVLHMKLDYSVVHQVLLDSSVTLHILMNDEFSMSKKRVMKTLYGVDSHLAFSMKDTRRLVGDSELRKQVKLPKAKLGFCTSLAIETNGTIFTARKLTGERAGARRISGVFGGRVAQSARPCTARPTRCECHTARLHCAPCLLRHRLVSDVSSALWASDEMDDMFDNILDINLPMMN